MNNIELLAEWELAKENGITRKEFADQKGLSFRQLKRHLALGNKEKREGVPDHVKQDGSNVIFEDNKRDGSGVVSGRVPPNMTEEQLIDHFQIDIKKWNIDKIIYAQHEGYRKDRSVEWNVVDGHVTFGEVHDSGKLRIEPLVSVKVFLSRKTIEIQNNSVVEDLIEDAKKYSPVYKKIKYPKLKDPVMYEIQMPDLQLGRIVDAEDVGVELNPDIAVESARKSVYSLLEYSSIFDVEKIVFPVGNDFFDANNADNKTAHGTLQRDDPRWKRTFRLGKTLLVELIDQMSTIAPVDVPVIVGNHDEERMWYMGDTLESWYSKNPNVKIDNSGRKRKYISYGKVLLGLTHGYWEKLSDLPGLMALEQKEAWATAVYREFHTGDKHHLKHIKVKQTADEIQGVTVRINRSLATPSVWEFDKGLLSLQLAESYIWHPEKGLIGQLNA